MENNKIFLYEVNKKSGNGTVYRGSIDTGNGRMITIYLSVDPVTIAKGRKSGSVAMCGVFKKWKKNTNNNNNW